VGRRRVAYQFGYRGLKERKHLESPQAEERIILKWIINKSFRGPKLH
jgi:hypothetical protein